MTNSLVDRQNLDISCKKFDPIVVLLSREARMRKNQKKLVQSKGLIDETIRQVGNEFEVTRREILEHRRGKENLLQLLAICLSIELSELPPQVIGRAFGKKSSEAVMSAPVRLKKYFEFIPGLSQKYERLKAGTIKKVGGF